jgi:hypothetical protein
MKTLAPGGAPGLLSLWAAVSLCCCGPLADTRTPAPDLRPPLVESVESVGPGELRVTFDEEATLRPEKTTVTPALAIGGMSPAGSTVVIQATAQVPGQRYVLSTEAADARGNSSSFLAEFYGFNGKVPGLLINEFTPRGSGTHPDCTELKVLTDGNLGGVVLYNGTPGSFDGRVIFPACAVRGGSFVIVHWKPSGIAGEVDEISDPAASIGWDSSDKALDFWARDSAALGGNNGVMMLLDRPGGRCIDGVLYSNRTSESDERYRGFGAEATLARAEELVSAGGWTCAGTKVVPEDGVSPEGSTGTRSLCRMPGAPDTNGPGDWHVVPTRKASFGAENTAEVYAP